MAKKSLFRQSATVSADSTTTVLEVNKPSKFLQSETVIPKKHKPAEWGKWFAAAGLTAFCISVGTAILGGWWYVNQFQQASGTNFVELLGRYRKEKSLSPISRNGGATFLLLGLDQSENQRETSLLTDTIMLAHFNKNNQSLSLYSLPRDLWIDSLKTKINALYYYGQQNGDAGGVTLLSSVVNEITGLPIDYYAIVNMDSLKQIIDAVGGVEVEIERSFEDTFYPREIDISSGDPAVLYETVVFTKGRELMDGERALKYIRSRHSQDTIEGTDEGRERRQQNLLTALKLKLVQPSSLSNPRVMGNLYRVWKEAFTSNIDEISLLSIMQAVGTNSPTFSSKLLPIQDASSSGLIYHPAKGPANQWVYLPVDPSWTEMRKWFSQ
jgi:LCP family protein required for cell wall assembly